MTFDGSIIWMRRKLKRDRKKKEREREGKKKSLMQKKATAVWCSCWYGCTQCKNSGSNSKANTNQPRHCSPVKARNFSGLIVLWNLISGEATPLDVVLLGKKRKKKEISLAKTGHASEIKKKKKSGKGCRRNIWKVLTPETRHYRRTGQQS